MHCRLGDCCTSRRESLVVPTPRQSFASRRQSFNVITYSVAAGRKKKEGFTKSRNALHILTLLQHSRRVGAYKTCTFLKEFPNCVVFKNWKWNMFTLLKTWFVFEARDVRKSTANYTFCNRYLSDCRTWIALMSFLVQQREPIKLISFPSRCRLIEDLARRCLV